MSEAKKSVLVSSPGKILITGGYLVLEGEYSGSVIGSNAKFLVGIKSKDSDDKTITVNSPQFEDLPWSYELTEGGVTSK
jgi:phosphomevalonate kinase